MSAVGVAAMACGVADEPTATPSVTSTPGATATATPGPTVTAVPGTPVDTVPEAKYLLLSTFELFYCDPYAYPIGRPDAEREAALEQFPELQENPDEFNAMVEYLDLDDVTEFRDDQKVEVFREHNRLNAVTVEESGAGYAFEMRITEANEGYAVKGTILRDGDVHVGEKVSSFNTCPICLASGALIATPSGDVPIENVRVGQVVWTQAASGAQVPSVVLEVAAKPSSPGQQVVRVALDDGRVLTASPAHPTTDGRLLAQLQAGDSLDDALVESVEWLPYQGAATYDILPAGGTGHYWADGVLLGSTLSQVDVQ